MTRIVIALVIAVTSTGCYGSQLGSMRKDINSMRMENENLRRQNAALKGTGEPQNLINVPDSNAGAVNPASRTAYGAQTVSATGRAWVRQPHGPYVCTADYDAYLSDAPRYKFTNRVDDRNGRWSNKTRRNSYLAVTMNGQPVVVVSGAGTTYFLAPDQSCWVEKGGADRYKIRAKLFTNVGSRYLPTLDQEPDGVIASSARRLFEGEYPLYVDELPIEFAWNHFSR